MARNITIMNISIIILFLLTGISSAGNIVSVSGIIESPPGIIADFSATPTSGTSPLLVRFTSLSSGTVSSYAWDFENDGIVDSRVKNPIKVFRNSGNYTVRLTVKGPEGTSTEIKEDYISVKEKSKPPVARFSQDMRVGFPPLTVHFTDRSRNNPTSFSWTFGDGTSSSDQNPVHTYTRAGVYRVTFVVSNENGSSTANGIVFVIGTRRFF